ncbi:MAG TPA: TylF/MycF/NovP-related O-methyltransferase [Aestuariivirga sp.]|nr:TylF/MycF/NovP-related O-methyltransferase [Aestuariivirga sp.]
MLNRTTPLPISHTISTAKRLVRKICALIGLDVSRLHRTIWSHDLAKDVLHQKILPQATFSPWLNDKDFLECYTLIKENTLVDVYRCYELWTIIKQLNNVGGCFLEVGVWRGGTGALIAYAAKSTKQNREIFLADTFEGVVKATVNDTRYTGGEHSDTSLNVVSKLLQSMDLRNVKILKGIFPDETSQDIGEAVAFLHCDVDVYQSTKDIVEWVLPRMNAGGIIIFDDYGFYGCEGVTRYAHELKQRDDLFFIHNLNGHAIFVKKSVLAL